MAQSVDGLAVKLLWYTPLLHTKLTTAARVYSITNTPPCVARTCGASPPSLLPIEHGVERLRLRHHVGYANSGGQRTVRDARCVMVRVILQKDDLLRLLVPKETEVESLHLH